MRIKLPLILCIFTFNYLFQGQMKMIFSPHSEWDYATWYNLVKHSLEEMNIMTSTYPTCSLDESSDDTWHNLELSTLIKIKSKASDRLDILKASDWFEIMISHGLSQVMGMIIILSSMTDETFYAVVKTHKRRSNKIYNSELTIKNI